MSDSEDQRESRLLNSISTGNILIVIVFGLTLIFEWIPVWVAIILSLLIWIIFGDIIGEIAIKWRQKAKVIKSGQHLHHYCSNCGLRYSSEKLTCPKCHTDKVEV